MTVSPDRRLAEIASHSDFVHEFARRILADHARAEDVAQSALAAALRGAPRDGLRAWLAAVVRNLASKSRRSFARRRDREHRFARRDRVPSPDEVVERERWRQRILAAVDALPAPQREAVLLRFFEGLPPRRIAERLGVPVETVKSRLKRGLENLRPKLVEEDPRSSLAGLGLVALGPAPWWPWVGSGKGVALVTHATKLKVAALAALVAGLPFATWVALRGDRNPQAGEEARVTALERAGDPMAAPRPGGETETRSAIGGVTAPEPAKRASLAGRVLVEDTGSPVAGVDVVLESSEEEFSARTGADGHYELALARPVRILRVRVAAGSETVATTRQVDVTLALGESRALDVRVGRGLLVRGVVLDEEDRPVPRAEVLGWCADQLLEGELGEPARRTMTDGEGRFSIAHLGDSAYVEARAAGRIPAVALETRLSACEVADGIVLRLTREYEHVVRVESPERTPIAGAEVSALAADLRGVDALTHFEGVFLVRPRALPRSATTDGSGTCTFTGLPPVTHRFVARCPQYPEGTVREEVGKEPEETVIVLKRGASLGGRVVAPDGAPVAGAEVMLRARVILGAATTDADGRFDMRSIETRFGAWLSVQARGYAAFVREPISSDLGRDDLMLRLEEERRVAGVVVLPDGSPASGVAVSIEGDRQIDGVCDRPLWKAPTWESMLCDTEVVTDEQGRFAFEGLYDGDFRIALAFEHEGVLRRLFVPTRSGTEDLSIVLEPSALEDVVFEGQVTDATTGAPVEAFSITVLGLFASIADYNSPKHDFFSPDGRFIVGGLAPMDLSLSVSAPGYRNAGAVPEPRAPGRHHLDVELFPVRVLEVRVTDQYGRAVPSHLRASDSNGGWLWLPVDGTGSTGTLSTGADGRAILQDLPAARVRVTVWPGARNEWPAGAKKSWEFPFDLSEPIEGLQELEIEVPD